VPGVLPDLQGGVVEMRIPSAGSDERRTVNSAHVLTRCNGAAADQKTASNVIRLGEIHHKIINDLYD